MPGFNLQGSNPQAIAIADQVMKAMGGRRNYDQTRYLVWNFFGRRDLVWDKWTGRVRIDSPSERRIYLLNVHDSTGAVYEAGQPVAAGVALNQMAERGKNIWINDSYWLVMPFKLKDSGVTLKYLRADTSAQGHRCDVLGLTFDKVGHTPKNRYEVFVDQSDHLVKQWAYYEQASQQSASNTWPWDNYKTYGSILLSGERSDGKGPQRIQVFENLPDSVFEDPSKPHFLGP